MVKNYNDFIKHSDVDGANVFMIDEYLQKDIIEEIKSNYYENKEFKAFSHPQTLENLFTISISSLFNDDYFKQLLKEDKENSKKMLEESEKLLKKYKTFKL